MSEKNDSCILSKALLDDHDTPETFEIKFDRYFKDFEQYADSNEVIIPEYFAISTQHNHATTNNIADTAANSQDKNPCLEEDHIAWESVSQNQCQENIVHGSSGMCMHKIEPSYGTSPLQVGSQNLLPLNHRPTCGLSCCDNLKESNETERVKSDVNYHSEFVTAINSSEKYSTGSSLQARTQLSFTLQSRGDLSEKKLPESRVMFLKRSVDSCSEILCAPIMYNEFEQKFTEAITGKTYPVCQIPQSVINATINGVNNHAKEIVWKSAFEQDVRHFIYMNTSNNNPDSEEYWSQCERNLNFDPPDDLGSIEATKLQWKQYSVLVSSIRKKREMLHALHNEQLEAYRKQFE